MHTQERKLPPTGKGGELLTERRYSVGLAKAIGEESDAEWRYQQVVQKDKLAGMLFSTSGASLRFQAVTGISRRNDSFQLRGRNSYPPDLAKALRWFICLGGPISAAFCLHWTAENTMMRVIRVCGGGRRPPSGPVRAFFILGSDSLPFRYPVSPTQPGEVFPKTAGEGFKD